jgi:hypothetical protein
MEARERLNLFTLLPICGRQNALRQSRRGRETFSLVTGMIVQIRCCPSPSNQFFQTGLYLGPSSAL